MNATTTATTYVKKSTPEATTDHTSTKHRACEEGQQRIDGPHNMKEGDRERGGDLRHQHRTNSRKTADEVNVSGRI
ncbi:Hypothetical predicted protein [Octopus vulgaris]|uniref:Uncharacterized protein n=1 Tax=Octopus vulgaris TaxID=6645 RepID=A0AA36F2P6_OCTVU|nr:Hypothetical predicted protein [Octopus vulgaris]